MILDIAKIRSFKKTKKKKNIDLNPGRIKRI